MNKSTCKDVRLLLPLYIDNMLSDEEMTEVREHLKKCDSCQNEYALLKGIMAKTAELEAPELSVGFAASLHKKLLEDAKLTEIGEEKKALHIFNNRKKIRIYSYAAACAAAVAISVLAFGNLPDSSSFISDTKNDAIETAMPVQTKMPIATENEETVLDIILPAATNAPTVAPPFARKTEKAENTVEINEVQNEEEAYAQPEKTEEAEQPETASRNMPMTASIITDDTEEDKTIDVEPTDKAMFDAAKNVAVSGSSDAAAIGGGAGGAAREAVPYDSTSEEEKFVITVEFSFNNEGINKALELMNDAEKFEEGYLIPLSQLSEYIELLKSAEGYISHTRYGIKNDQQSDNSRIDYAIIVIK